jgi:hypothetical protein
MFGTHRQLIAVQCVVCHKYVAMRVDTDDLAQWRGGVLCQDAFVDENGVPYISAADRELLCLSRMCGACWTRLVPTDPLAYS